MLFPSTQPLYLWAGASLPSWKPFLKRRVIVFRYFMRPVPWPRRRELFRAQLSTHTLRLLHVPPHNLQCLILASGYPQEPQRPFWMWKARRLHLLQIVWVLVCFLPKEEVPLVYAHGYSRFSQFQHHPFSILLLSFNNILSCLNHYSPFRY